MAQENKKREEGKISSLCLHWDLHPLQPLGITAVGSWAFRVGLGLNTIGPSGSRVFRFGLEIFHWLSWFFGLQMADDGTPQPPYVT
jgi:hypothetical protein